MTVKLRFSIEMKASVQDTQSKGVNRELGERLRQLAQKVAADKEKMTEVYKITFLDLLLGDFYSDILRRKLKLKKEKAIILPVATEMNQKDSAFFKSLFEEPLDESLSTTRDITINHLFGQFKNPTITDVHFECTDTGAESEDLKKENL